MIQTQINQNKTTERVANKISRRRFLYTLAWSRAFCTTIIGWVWTGHLSLLVSADAIGWKLSISSAFKLENSGVKVDYI